MDFNLPILQVCHYWNYCWLYQLEVFSKLFNIAGTSVSNAANEESASKEYTRAHGLAGQLHETRCDSVKQQTERPRHHRDTENRSP